MDLHAKGHAGYAPNGEFISISLYVSCIPVYIYHICIFILFYSSTDSYSVTSDVPSDSSAIDDVNIHNASNVLEENIDVSENDLNEDSENQSFVYEGNLLLDWSADVENYDIEEEYEVEKLCMKEMKFQIGVLT